jgi:CTP-dependent riboflavin kinase
MRKRIYVNGTVVSGRRQGAFFTQLDWVRSQCLRQLGFAPAPGTLNLRVAPGSMPAVEELLRSPGRPLVPPDPAFCSGKVFPAEIEGIPAAVVFPATAVRSHSKNIIEVMSPAGLRDSLGLKDGDPVTLTVERDHPDR